MKHFKRFLGVCLTLCMMMGILTTFVAASETSSAYLDGYRAGLTAKSGGKIAITVDVSGVGSMTEIGASKIYLYESTDGSLFSRIETFESDDYPKMLGAGTWYYDTPITYDGTAGNYYYAIVYCYAANSSGSDTGGYETEICRAIS